MGKRLYGATVNARLHCLNRCAAEHLENFVVGLTNDDPVTLAPVYKSSYTICGQYNGYPPTGKNGTVICAPSSETFRYVLLHGSRVVTSSLCISEVYVRARSKQQLMELNVAVM